MRRFQIIICLGTSFIGFYLGACDRTAQQRAVAPDPKASQWSGPVAALPEDFPTVLQYPAATLSQVTAVASPFQENAQETASTLAQTTQWRSNDPLDQVVQFYRQRLKGDDWQGFREETVANTTQLSAHQANLQVLVSLPVEKPATPSSLVEFKITYQKGAVPQNNRSGASSGSSGATNGDTTQAEILAQVPPTLQSYVRSVLELGVGPSAATFVPNQPISRATFARWLVAVNNRIYRDRPARQIRTATASAAAFADVPPTHPDFGVIQGLAEAGYIPSSLSGDATQTQFRPSSPLTRETLLLWKVPIDRQQSLPTVSSTRVTQLWGFKDANRITPPALSAVAADAQNGDLSNIRRVLGSTLLFQPQKPVTQAEAAAALWFIGTEGESLSVPDLLRAEQQEKATGTSSSSAVSPSSSPSTAPPSRTPASSPTGSPSGPSP